MDELVRLYFREAFRLPMLRVDLGDLERDPRTLPLAKINRDVPHRMVQTRSEWDQPVPTEHERSSEAPWMESLVATEGSRLIQQTDPTQIPVLARSWDRMDPETQRYVRQVLGNAQGLYERLLVLERLAEQLQQQVLELEAHVDPGPPHKTGERGSSD